MINFVFFDVLLENFGVEILTSVLKANNYNVATIIENSDSNNFSRSNFTEYRIDSIVKKIMNMQPDIVGFSALTENYQIYRKVAKKIKDINEEIFIVMGGIHTTLTKEAVMKDEFVDFAIIGEGEEAIIELLSEIKNGGNYSCVRNLCYRDGNRICINPCRPYIRDLDSLPFPDKSAYLEKNTYLQKRYLMVATRGCFGNCTYCSSNALHKLYKFEKNHVRSRSPENVVEELVEGQQKYNYDSVFFVDDIFTYNRVWLRKFVHLYKETINLPLDCRIHPNFITPEVADLIKEMNTQQVSIGIQTADEAFRKNVLKRNESNEAIEKAIKLLKKRGIKVVADHILGLPGETFDSIKFSVDCYSRWGPTDVSVRWLSYFPGTDIIRLAHDEGIISTEDVEKINQGEYSDNYNKMPYFKSKRKTRKYIQYHILMSCFGVLPGRIIRFLNNNINWVIPLKIIPTLLQLFPGTGIASTNLVI